MIRINKPINGTNRMPGYSELMGESNFEDRLFTGFASHSPYEMFEPRPCMEMMERRIEEEARRNKPLICWTCKKQDKKWNMIRATKTMIFSGRLLPIRDYCSASCKAHGEKSIQKQVDHDNKLSMNYRMGLC